MTDLAVVYVLTIRGDVCGSFATHDDAKLAADRISRMVNDISVRWDDDPTNVTYGETGHGYAYHITRCPVGKLRYLDTSETEG